jgi:hypothetical protein
LILISYWGAGYIAIATFMARITSQIISQIIENDILPFLSNKVKAKIGHDIATYYDDRWINVVSIIATFLMITACGYAIKQDLGATVPSFQLMIWSIGNLPIFFYAARTTYVARFYILFGKNIGLDADKLFALDPLRTPLLINIFSLGQHILRFWFVIGLAISCLIPITILGANHLNWYIYVMVPVTSFFSLIFGSLVFFRNWYEIRILARRIINKTISRIQDEVSLLFEDLSLISQEKLKKLESLLELQRNLSTTQPIRVVFVALLSILSPLIGLIATIIKMINPS